MEALWTEPNHWQNLDCEIILWKGLPFRPSIPAAGPKAVDELSKEEFDSMMAIGLAQAKNNQSSPVNEVFERLIGEIQNA